MTRKAVFFSAAATWVALDVIGAATGLFDPDAKETVDVVFGSGMSLWLHWIVEDAA